MTISELYKKACSKKGVGLGVGGRYIVNKYCSRHYNNCVSLIICFTIVLRHIHFRYKGAVEDLIRKDLEVMSEDELWEFLDKLHLEVVLKRYEVI